VTAGESLICKTSVALKLVLLVNVDFGWIGYFQRICC